jgi:peptidoglycan/LPS O-acetylase OafA/YrhL
MHQKNSDIQTLRAVAIIMVILWHSSDLVLNVFGLKTADFGSWTGVDLFFSISGYVIVRSLLKPRFPPQIRQFLSQFYIKRIFRIFPSAILCIVFSLLLAIALEKYAGREFFLDTRNDAIPSLLNFANIAYFYKTANHGGTLLGIFWSLSLEEQFYLLIPLLVWFFRKRLRTLIPILLSAAIFQFFLHRDPWEVLAWSTRTDGLIYGVLIAIFECCFVGQFKALSLKVSNWRRLIGWLVLPLLILILATIASEHARVLTRFSTGWVSVVGGLLVAFAAFDQKLLFGGRIISFTLLWTGSRSFSLYLYHNIALVLTKGMNLHFFHITMALNNPSYYLLLLVGCGMLVGLAEANYRVVEVPLRNFGRRLAAA